MQGTDLTLLLSSGEYSKEQGELSSPLAWSAANTWHPGRKTALPQQRVALCALCLAGWQFSAAGGGQWACPGNRFAQVKPLQAPAWAVSPGVSSVPWGVGPALGRAPQQCCTSLFGGVSAVVLPWVQRCALLLPMGRLSARVEGCELGTPQPAMMHPLSHPARNIGTWQQPAGRWGNATMPHQVAPGTVFRGHHHLLGTTRPPQDGEIAPVSPWMPPPQFAINTPGLLTHSHTSNHKPSLMKTRGVQPQRYPSYQLDKHDTILLCWEAVGMAPKPFFGFSTVIFLSTCGS